VSARELATLHLAEQAETSESALLMGRYRLGKRLGSGAFGTVWRARDERLDRDVAVKLLPRERVVHARFEREARAAARLQHPAIVTLYEAAVDDEGAYLVSELVRGRTLDALLEQGRLSDRAIVEVGIALCDALDHAHRQGVIHRDVKPSNVLVPGRAGSSDRAKLTDFGVAQVIGADALTRTGDVIGTLAYMAPEQADGREVGPEADLYSLALILYEALSGVNPQLDSRRRGRRAFVPPLRRQRRDLSPALASGIDQAMRPRPQERGTIDELRASLLESVDLAGDTRGVVAPAGRVHDDATWVQEQPGPEWREDRTRRDRPVAGASGLLATGSAEARLTWIPRAANAAAAGLGIAWLSAHLFGHPPAPVALIALVAAVIALLAPLVGSLGTAIALGVVGLGGAYPAVVAQLGRGWLRRSLVAAAGLCLLVGVSKATDRNLYWLPREFPPTHARGMLAIAVWAAAAAFQPLLRLRGFAMLELGLCAAWSAAVVIAVQAAGASPLRGVAAGALAAVVIVAWRPLSSIVEETRRSSGKHADVA
jgi:eukaryotic-like serine/threonine-protein kinase